MDEKAIPSKRNPRRLQFLLIILCVVIVAGAVYEFGGQLWMSYHFSCLTRDRSWGSSCPVPRKVSVHICAIGLLGETGIDFLTSKVDTGSNLEKVTALQILTILDQRIGARSAASISLRNGSEELQDAAVYALSRYPDETETALRSFLDSSSAYIRTIAFSQLFRRGSCEDMDGLISSALDRNEGFRGSTMLKLKWKVRQWPVTGCSQTVAMLKRIAETDSSAFCRETATELLQMLSNLPLKDR